MKYRIAIALIIAIALVGCGGNGADRNLFALCKDGFKEYETNCQFVCKDHGGVRQFGLKGGHCANFPPL